MAFVIRRLAPQDAPTYRALRLRALEEHPEAFTSSVEEEAARAAYWSLKRLTPDDARPHDFFLGAFVEETLSGIVGVEGRYRPKERHNASVVGMFVANALAGQGAGLALMREAIRLAELLPGLEQLDLTVTAGNDRAQALYAGCGFTVYGTLPRAIQVQGTYHDKVHMALRLRGR